ncbi:unnamed protein product [Urochloa humidicola]
MSAPPSPVHMSRDRRSLSPSPPDAGAVGRGLHASPQPQHQEESDSGSELDSPRITFLTKPEEPHSPTSPPGSPPSANVNPSGTQRKCKHDEIGEWSPEDSSNDEEDPYFKSLVDNFTNATADMCNSTLSDDDIDLAEDQRRSVLYAESALKHYNNDDKNKIKYELISGITCCDILEGGKGCYSHVNFTAKGNQQSSEELFFAELRRDGGNLVSTCVLSLEGIKKVGGYCGSRYDNKFYGERMPIDTRHCYACDHRLKHPKNGELYVLGHVAASYYYDL